jgi:hypothetical protein
MRYIISGKPEMLGACNLIDKWAGNFRFNLPVMLSCGCYIYTGDLELAQGNNWPQRIRLEDDFGFELVCVCGSDLFHGQSASQTQDLSGWAYIF